MLTKKHSHVIETIQKFYHQKINDDFIGRKNIIKDQSVIEMIESIKNKEIKNFEDIVLKLNEEINSGVKSTLTSEERVLIVEALFLTINKISGMVFIYHKEEEFVSFLKEKSDFNNAVKSKVIELNSLYSYLCE